MSFQFDDPIQQEVWNTLRALNDAWTLDDGSTLDQYFHPKMLAIAPMDRNRHEGHEACMAGWKNFARTVHIQSWQEKEPVVHVYGDAAVVSYYFDMSYEVNGCMQHSSGRDLFFFIRENGKWWAVADQFSPYPSPSTIV